MRMIVARSKLAWAGVLGCAAMAGLGGALAAADSSPAEANPYSVIWDRNVFHLNPEPIPPPPEPPKPAELPKVMLTGIVGKGSSIKVYLAIPPKDAKESTYYTGGLVPGQKDHDVELVAIRADEEEVDIINSGTRQTLSVRSNSYASTATETAAAPHTGGGPHGMPPGMMFRHQPHG